MILSLLLAAQAAGHNTTPTPAIVTPAMLVKMDSVFAKPILAPFRAAYLRDREKGLKAETINGYIRILIGDFRMLFYPGTDRIRAFISGNGDPTPGESLPQPLLMATAKAAIEQLSDEPRPDRQGKPVKFGNYEPNEFLVVARRVAYGLPVSDAFGVTINVVTGNVLRFGNDTEKPLSVEPHGGDPILPVEELREIGYSQLLRDRPPFDQAELVTDETVIEPDYRNKGVAIPKHGMGWMASHGYYGVSIDARDGRVIGGGFNPAQGGGVPEDAQPWPKRLRVRKVEGTSAILDKTAADPSGTAVAVQDGKTLFLGRFAPKDGTLWLRRMKDEPYRGFRPEPKLRKALAAQVKRTAVLAKKKS